MIFARRLKSGVVLLLALVFMSAGDVALSLKKMPKDCRKVYIQTHHLDLSIKVSYRQCGRPEGKIEQELQSGSKVDPFYVINKSSIEIYCTFAGYRTNNCKNGKLVKSYRIDFPYKQMKLIRCYIEKVHWGMYAAKCSGLEDNGTLPPEQDVTNKT